MSLINDLKESPIESTNDYFSDQKQNNIVSTSFETLNPLDIICYEEDIEEFELFHSSEETYITSPDK